MAVFRLLTFVAWMGWTAAVAAQPVDAARNRIAQEPAIENIDVEQVERLDAGVPLRFGVFGSERAAVTVAIEGARRLLVLAEAQPGIYEGTYVIDGDDAIRPESRVVATLQRRGQVVRSTLEEPLVLEHAAPPWASAADTRAPMPLPAPVETVPIDAPRRTSAAVAIDGAARATVAPADPRVVVAVPVPARALRRACVDCAVVESIKGVEAPPRRGPLGTVSGAVFGALFGKEVAENHLSRMRRVLGPLGEPLVGAAPEAQGAATTQYDVVLRLPDGSTLLRRYETSPGLQPGDTVSLSGSEPR